MFIVSVHLEEALHAGPQLRVRVVWDVAAARRPHGSVGDACTQPELDILFCRINFKLTLKEFKGKHEPGPRDERNVDESDDISEESHHQDLHVAILGDNLEAVEVGSHLRNVVDDRCDAKNCWMTTIVLFRNK